MAKTKNAPKPEAKPEVKDEATPTPAANGKPTREPKPCPVTREEFNKNAKHVTLTLDGIPIYLMPREFSTGSFGWGANQKIPVKVGDQMVMCSVNLQFIVQGSKDTE